ncbi:TNF receptor-associated factor 5-like [Xenia sp. Carnegie-2017]|uniref:TNF receptor-associated factor 5-like n=1 Tax=Xenia sp. Carnegie-2017 TaxID=2897299 RepID=UPI001F042AB2|nr:TNF receptor-associated factor 5-like [Xenia sp. Carnegie-2017]
MAENKTRGQGFDRHWFVEKRALQFQCGVCSNVVKYPYQIVNCGHHACRDCLSRDLKDVRECPVCNVEIKDFKTEIFPDTSVKIKVFGLLMKCPDKKCKWKGELRQFLEKHENECPFGVLKCPNEKCNERVTREDLKKHLEACPYREIKCPHCGITLYFKDEKRHLEEQCLKIPVDCAQGCGKQIIKEQIQDHIDNECENTLIDCKYKDLGCDELVERGNIEDHESSNVASHLAKAVDVIRNLKEEKRALTEKLRKFDEKHESLDRKMTDSIETQKTHSNKIESDLKEFVKMGSLSLENVKKATEQNFENNERNGIEVEEQRNELQHLNNNIIPVLKNDITINEDEIIKLIGTTNDLKKFTVAFYNELKHEHDDQRQVMDATIDTLRHDLVIEKTERIKNENKTGEHLAKVNAKIGDNIRKLKQMQGEILVSQDATKEKFSQQYKQIQSNCENLLEMIKKRKVD